MGIEGIFHGSVDDQGAFHAEDPEAFRNARMAMRRKQVTITMGEFQEDVSEEQYGYYFGVMVTLIAERMGERSKAKVHKILKGMFLYDLVAVKKTGSTKEQDKKSMKIYMDTIREWAAGEPLNLDIPDPDRARVQKKRKKE